MTWCLAAVVVAGLVYGTVLAGAAHAQTADDAAALNTEAVRLYRVSKYREATEIAERALAMREKVLGPEHPEVGASLSNLGELYRAQGRHADAEPLHRRSLAIREKALGPKHPDVGISVNNLARLYRDQGRYAEAEVLMKRALVIAETALGPDHPDVGIKLNNLADLYVVQGRYAEAEPSMKRALAITERARASNHPDVGTGLNNLGDLYRVQGRHAEAEPLLKRALAIIETALGPDHPNVGASLSNIADLYRDQGRYAEAEPLLKRALAIADTALGPDHPSVGDKLNGLARVYRAQGRYAEAEALLKRALAIAETALGPNHSAVGVRLSNLGDLYHAQGRYAEAEPLMKRTLAIIEAALGPDHPDIGTSLNNLGNLYSAQGRYAEAEPLFKRDLAIIEAALGPDHPDIGAGLSNLAELYRFQGRNAEAEALMKRALVIAETALGPDHPTVGARFNNLAFLALAREDLAGAANWWRHATTLLRRRTERGLGGGGLAKGEAQQSFWFFSGLIKTTHRLAAGGEEGMRGAMEMFETAQWAGGSEAAASLALMAARSAKGSQELSLLVRERQDLVREWQGKDTQLIAAKSQVSTKRNATAEKALSDRLAAIDTRFAAIDEQLAKDFPDYAALARPTPLSVAEVQANLDSGEALVLFVDTDDRLRPLPEETFVWVVTKSQVRWIRSELGTSALGHGVAALRCGLDATAWHGEGALRCADLLKMPLDKAPKEDDPLPFDLARANALYKGLFGEVADLIKGKHLFVIPPRPLTQLPFQVLVADLPRGVVAGQGARQVGRLGAELAPLRDEDRATLPTDVAGAVRIVQTIAGGPADSAGLLSGDILLALDRRGFATVQEAVSTVQAAGPGSRVAIRLIRSGRDLTLPATLGSATVQDSKPLFLSVDSARQTAWLAREHAITVLPAVSSLKALRRVGRPSSASRPMIGVGNPLLDGPDVRYGTLAQQARGKQRCADQRPKQVAARGDYRAGPARVKTRGDIVNVDDIKGQVPLPETADELCAVAQYVNAQTGRDILLGAKATEREVKRLSAAGEMAKYRIVHFATHGVLAGDLNGTADPGLILTPPGTATQEDDGYLSASEVAGLKLDADWVILSACNTAAGGAQGAEALSGLARAFIYAGARALLVSHCAVSSEATVSLVTHAVGAISRDKKLGRAEALRRAMLAMIDKGKPHEAHPAYWAPFIVVGEGAAAK